MKSRSKKPGKKEFNHIPVISIFVRKQKEKNNEGWLWEIDPAKKS